MQQLQQTYDQLPFSNNPEVAPAFCSETYLAAQMDRFNHSIDRGNDLGSGLIIEFGGKPFGDYHAARVLPGYDPDIKAGILRSLQQERDTQNIMVVNARDILPAPHGRTANGRIRGDSKLRYDQETLRIIIEAAEVHGISIESAALAVTPDQSSDFLVKNAVVDFKKLIKNGCGLDVALFPEIKGYPDPYKLNSSILLKENLLHTPERPTVLMSPGGGSGKFGVAFSELFASASSHVAASFAKFETFPVFNLPPDHPLNLAFEAATADLGNTVFSYNDGRTNYDKDDQNFRLLGWLARTFPSSASHLDVESPFEFSVNVIEKGILNPNAVHLAALQEIERRIARYTEEAKAGDEKQTTIARAKANLTTCKNFISNTQLEPSEISIKAA